MKKTEMLSSTVNLACRFSMAEFAWSLLVLVVVAAFAFVFAPPSAGVASQGNPVACAIWQVFGAAARSGLGESSVQLLSRGCGSVFAGISAAVSFVVVRYFLFLVLRKLRLLEYYRISGRLLIWSLAVALSIALSRAFIDLFVPVTPTTVDVMLGCVVIGLTIHFIRVNHPFLLIVAYALAGVLSALSVTGIVALAVLVTILVVSKNHVAQQRFSKWMTGYGYGGEYAYGSYGVYGTEGAYGFDDTAEVAPTRQDGVKEAQALMAERLRLSLFLFFALGFVATLSLILVFGRSQDVSVRTAFLDWGGCYVAEVKNAMAASKLFFVACCEAIAVVFVLYRFDRLLDAEHYLTASDMVRVILSAMIAAAVLLGIGSGTFSVTDFCAYEIRFVPFAVQVVAGLVILMAVVVFLINMRCRKFIYSEGDVESRAMIRQYSRMGALIVVFFDVSPAVLLAIATFHIRRAYL